MDSFECTECDKTFNKRFKLTAHRRLHNGTAFACDLCEKRFERKENLSKHRIAHTFTKPFACDVDGCRKVFTRKGHMMRHIRTVHEKVRQYACKQCDRRFSQKSTLTTHHRIHTGERPYACTECAMRVNGKANLQKHYRAVHTLERYTCDVDGCEKTFTQSRNMQMHKRSVHETVPDKHRCEQCPDRTFTGSGALNSHRRTHNADRPFACSQCAMKFTQKAYLRAHQRARHQESS